MLGSSSGSDLVTVQHGKVLEIRLNDPEHLNVLNDDRLRRISEAISDAEANDSINVIVIGGEGRAFCAGWDLRSDNTIHNTAPGERVPHRDVARLYSTRHEIYMRILFSQKLTVCQVQGWVLGAGCYLAMVCDYIVAATDTKLSFGHTRYESCGAGFELALLSAHCGPRKARELLQTGRVVGAEELERLNLINYVVEPDKLHETTFGLANNLAILPRDGLALSKLSQNWWYSSALGFSAAHWQHTAMRVLNTTQSYGPDEPNPFEEFAQHGVGKARNLRDERLEATSTWQKNVIQGIFQDPE